MACSIKTISEIEGLFKRFSIYKENLIYLKGLHCSNINRLISKVDPYSKWIPASNILEDKKNIVGIGAVLFEKKGRFFLAPYRFSSLFKYSKGEFIELFAINGWVVRGKSYKQVVERLRGPKSSLVLITFKLRKGLKSIYVVRESYERPAVEFIHLGDKAFFRIFHFSSREVTNFIKDKLEGFNFRKVILDLRPCPGGDLFEALDLASLFLAPKKRLVFLEDSKGKRQLITVPTTLPTFKHSIQVMVSSYTASAAEVFAGVMKYYNRAKISGEKTVGKCVSQGEYHLSDGSILRISNLKIYFPDMSTCQGKGISPNN